MKRKAFLASIFGAFGAAQAQEIGDFVKGSPAPKTVGHGTADWEMGPALNNQCPVCRTMAEPYARLKINCCMAGCSPNEPKCDAQKERIVRCKRCNAAFWQDAAK